MGKAPRDALAVYGGAKTRVSPLPAWPHFGPQAVAAAAKVLRSGRTNYWGGIHGTAFEEEFSAWAGKGHAVAVSSGTAALHLALEALGIGPGDQVVTTAYSFRASATAVLNAGAEVVYADTGDDHMINAETVKAVLTPRVKAVIVVHLYGQVADMAPIMKLARQRSFKVIEDCAQCLGGTYRGSKTGTIGDAGCFSFCQYKHITTGGEGGMVLCRSRSLRDKVRSLRDHGWKVGTVPKEFTDCAGYNFRMTEVQSVLGRCALAGFDGWNLPRRRMLAGMIAGRLAEHPLVKSLPVDTPARRASFWLVPVVLDTAKLRVGTDVFIEALQAEGVPAYAVRWPLMAPCAKARELLSSTIAFWVHPVYTARIADETCTAFCKVAKAFMK